MAANELVQIWRSVDNFRYVDKTWHNAVATWPREEIKSIDYCLGEKFYAFWREYEDKIECRLLLSNVKLRITRDLSTFWTNIPSLVLVCDEIVDNKGVWIPLAKCLFQGKANIHFDTCVFSTLSSSEGPSMICKPTLKFRLVKRLSAFENPVFVRLEPDFATFVRLYATVKFCVTRKK